MIVCLDFLALWSYELLQGSSQSSLGLYCCHAAHCYHRSRCDRTSRATAQGTSKSPGIPYFQSALIDKHNSVVTYSVTSHANHTSTVIFDMRHGLVCYKPDNQDSCFLRRMERLDYENVQSQLNKSEQQVWVVGNQTEKHTEFLGVLSGSRVEASTLQEPLQSLCQQASVYWTRRSDGPGKQRLIYFCIDICFPSNICVSVCFYYLPE
uniref:BRICHOS domain containing 5 n=1 Tax=Sinocyclocheilus rhinocerous TaxID=307959 RepID=A0A673J2J4_9TELE